MQGCTELAHKVSLDLQQAAGRMRAYMQSTKHIGGKYVRLAAESTTAPTRGVEALQVAVMHPGGQHTGLTGLVAQDVSYEQDGRAPCLH